MATTVNKNKPFHLIITRSERDGPIQIQVVLRGRTWLHAANVFAKVETGAGLPRSGTRSVAGRRRMDRTDVTNRHLPFMNFM